MATRVKKPPMFTWEMVGAESWRFEELPFWGVVRRLDPAPPASLGRWRWTVGVRGFQMSGVARSIKAAQVAARKALSEVLEELGYGE